MRSERRASLGVVAAETEGGRLGDSVPEATAADGLVTAEDGAEALVPLGAAAECAEEMPKTPPASAAVS